MSCLFRIIVRKLAESCGEWRVDWFFFFFLRSTEDTQKMAFSGAKTFFFGDHLILAEKPPLSNTRLMKIWVKFVY